MKKEELIERYIYAVTRYLRKSEKEDIAKELKSIIDDMIEEQYGDKEPNEYQIKAILSELGTPLELYEKYSQDGKECLIGAPYFGIYKFVIKLVTACVIFGMFIAGCLTVMNEQPVWYEAIATIIAPVFGGVLSGFAIVTIIFAYLYRKQVKIDAVFDSLDNLPQLPKKEDKISGVSVLVGIIISILFTTLFLVCPQILCAVNTKNNEVIPIFNVDFIRQTWYLIVIFAVLGIGREIMKLIEGRYTKRLMLVTIVTDGLSAVFTIIWLLNDNILNPRFKEMMSSIFTDAEPFLQNIMASFNIFFMGIILFALILDVITVICKTERA